MKKSIIISIKPKWVEKILNGEKTIEIRKSMPKCDLPIDVYIYCCKSNNGSLNYFGKEEGYHYMPYDKEYWTKEDAKENENLCGKMVAKFTLNKFERFDVPYPAWFYEVKDKLQHITNGSRLGLMSLHHYLRNDSGYAWYIDNLEIFDEPLELNEFYKNNYLQIIDHLQTVGCDSCYCPYLTDDGCDIMYCSSLKINKAPQSWCYAYKEKYKWKAKDI